MTTPTTRRIDQATVAAAEYARLVRDGRYPEADQTRRTIEELVGRYTRTGRLAIPPAVRRVMGVAR